jgi:hypothetical protein
MLFLFWIYISFLRVLEKGIKERGENSDMIKVENSAILEVET